MSALHDDWSQFAGIYYREVVKTFRNPWVILITLAQPFMWLAFFGSSFSGLSCAEIESIFHTPTCNYVTFLLPGVLATSMLTIGMFGAMSVIQDKRLGYLKRVLITPTRKSTIFLAKALGATTRGLVQFPVMIVAAFFFGVSYATMSPLFWAGWILALFLLGIGFSSLYLIVTAHSTDWQTPGVLSNFITMPLMFSSQALFPAQNFPWWMQGISSVNPVTYAATFGRNAIVYGTGSWIDLGYLAIFAVAMLLIGFGVYARFLRVE